MVRAGGGNVKLKRVRTAIVGCGMISRKYLENLCSRFHIIEVVGCADILPEAANKRAMEFGIQAMTMEEIVNDPTIEMAINLTAPTAHYQVIRQLLEAGKHVYTEKVMALELEQARDLVRLANEKRLYLGSAPDTFLGAGIQTARFVLDSGMIGEPTGVVAVLNRDNGVGTEFIPYIAKAGGGIGFDVGIYYMTAIIYLMGSVDAVCGFMSTRNPDRIHYLPSKDNFGESYHVDCENIFSGALHFANGAGGTLQFNSECIMNPYPFLTIYGTQGIMYLPDPDAFGGEVRVLRRGAKETFAVPCNHGYSDNSRGLGAAEMAWALRAGRQPRASKEMALHALEVLHGVSTSSSTGSTVKIQSVFTPTKPLPQGFQRVTGFADFLADEEAALV